MHQDEQITASEAADILRCSRATVNRMAADGRLPIVQKLPGIRGHNLFSRALVEHIARQQQQQEARSA